MTREEYELMLIQNGVDRALGLLGDNINYLQEAIHYLERATTIERVTNRVE